MNHSHCPDNERLVTHLYGEADEAERQRMETHLASCAACRDELAELSEQRANLAAWAPPEAEIGVGLTPGTMGRASQPAWWHVPRWAWGAIAATLVAAAAAGIANVEIRSAPGGLIVRTGWAAPAPAVEDGARARPADAPWRTDLAALEGRLRKDFMARGRETAGAALRTSDVSARDHDAAVLRRVRTLIEDSERRQQRELALRLAQATREFDALRRVDLVRIQRGIGQFEGLTGAEVKRQGELLNYLVRVSQRR